MVKYIFKQKERRQLNDQQKFFLATYCSKEKIKDFNTLFHIASSEKIHVKMVRNYHSWRIKGRRRRDRWAQPSDCIAGLTLVKGERQVRKARGDEQVVRASDCVC